MDYFKETDQSERDIAEVIEQISDPISNNLEDFFKGAYTAYPLGDAIYLAGADPTTRVLSQEFYRTAFFAIHDLFTRAGTFEFYLEVFRAIWGEDVQVDFVIPSAGVLLINLEVVDTVESQLIFRQIIGNVYEYNEAVTTGENDNIMVQISQGPRTQEEIDIFIRELHPNGIFVRANLV